MNNALEFFRWGPLAHQWGIKPAGAVRFRTTDTRLSAEVNPGNPDALGSMVWTGYSKILATLNQMPAKDRAKVVRKIRDNLQAKFGSELASSELSPGAAGSLTANNEPAAIQNEFWDKRLGRSTTKDHSGPALSTAATPASIQQANSDFWAARNAPQADIRRPWGKG
jgi:hypothetical protein